MIPMNLKVWWVRAIEGTISVGALIIAIFGFFNLSPQKGILEISTPIAIFSLFISILSGVLWLLTEYDVDNKLKDKGFGNDEQIAFEINENMQELLNHLGTRHKLAGIVEFGLQLSISEFQDRFRGKVIKFNNKELNKYYTTFSESLKRINGLIGKYSFELDCSEDVNARALPGYRITSTNDFDEIESLIVECINCMNSFHQKAKELNFIG